MNINLGAYDVGLVTEEVGAVAAIASSDVFNVLRLTLSKKKKKNQTNNQKHRQEFDKISK